MFHFDALYDDQRKFSSPFFAKKDLQFLVNMIVKLIDNATQITARIDPDIINCRSRFSLNAKQSFSSISSPLQILLTEYQLNTETAAA